MRRRRPKPPGKPSCRRGASSDEGGAPRPPYRLIPAWRYPSGTGMRPPNDPADHGPPSEPRDRLPRASRALTSRLSEPLSPTRWRVSSWTRRRLPWGPSWRDDVDRGRPAYARDAGARGREHRRRGRAVRAHPARTVAAHGRCDVAARGALFESRAEFRHRYEAAERRSDRSGDGRRSFSYACLPFVVGGRAIGGVSLVFPHTHAFGEDERMFLTVLAHHAAQALDRASLFEREKMAHQRLASLQQLTSGLSSAATVEAVAMLATRVGAETLALSGAGLWATDDLGDLSLVGEYGMSRGKPPGVPAHPARLHVARRADRPRAARPLVRDRAGPRVGGFEHRGGARAR